MNTVKQMLAVAALAMSAALPLSGFAQTNVDQSKMDMVSPSMTDGEVKKVDQDTGKVTIKHGDIKHLEMPGMTMVFAAKDKALLDKVQVGDKIRFMVVSEGGKMVVTAIEPAK